MEGEILRESKVDLWSFRQAIGDSNLSPRAQILCSSFLDNPRRFGIMQIEPIPVVPVISQPKPDLLEEIMMICSRKVSSRNL